MLPSGAKSIHAESVCLSSLQHEISSDSLPLKKQIPSLFPTEKETVWRRPLNCISISISEGRIESQERNYVLLVNLFVWAGPKRYHFHEEVEELAYKWLPLMTIAFVDFNLTVGAPSCICRTRTNTSWIQGWIELFVSTGSLSCSAAFHDLGQSLTRI
jgi:hypothetical protein